MLFTTRSRLGVFSGLMRKKEFLMRRKPQVNEASFSYKSC
ncbi:hypothetical protein OTSANNIE_0238 [Anaplasma phagocytophilum str. Annie]|nr:hypothetical protein APHWEB_0453 [Anaplasma phagocytophilum str. Webster]KJV88476.1 hypothetical protein APHNYW_0011 [Anaplasma phagocytophilum str. ApNYW]KJV99646.1 hypothetical protein OTSANNIE_0238 [Anaplasma phagocytophilum str. Annie]